MANSRITVLKASGVS